MQKSYFIFVVAHSIRGRIRSIHIPYYALYAVCALALVGAVTVFGAVGSYTRMLLKVAHYNHMRQEVQALQKKYHDLQGAMNGQQQQLASLQSLASEVSLAYGLRQVHVGTAEAEMEEGTAASAYHTSIAQYRMLIRATYVNPFERQSLLNDAALRSWLPSLWPLEGTLTGSFGERLDPFSGEGAFHSGLDISSAYGAPVRATADGVVVDADRTGGYGRLVDIEHGRGLMTRYAHLSGFTVVPGQAVKAGEIIGYVGRSGKSTGSHVHYEIRVNGLPVNPMRYLRHGLNRASAAGPNSAQGLD